jgi:tol-pal system protein YbgF
MHRLIAIAMLCLLPLSLAAQARAQDRAQTLADLRAEVATLAAEVSGLKRELVTTGAVQTGVAGGSALERMDAMEAALAQLTAKTEALELRVGQIVADGTNRIGDIEFRLTELEGGDVAALPPTPTLGGDTAVTLAPAPSQPADAGAPQLAVSEQADFDRAREVLGQGDFRTAADLLATFAQSYPGSPLSGEAQYLRGEALTSLGDTANAARAYLESFSGTPNGPQAPQALLKLGVALGKLGQTPEACVTLTEVGVRFGTDPAASEAQAALQGLACP